MSHRVEQIIEAFAALVDANFNGSVYIHRALSLSEEEGELPAISIDFGEDSPLDDDGASNLAFLDSLVSVMATIYTRGSEEIEVRRALMAARTAMHIAIMADRTLGLSFVVDTRYGGADEPEINAETEYLAGRLVCRWAVHYRMNITDPS